MYKIISLHDTLNWLRIEWGKRQAGAFAVLNNIVLQEVHVPLGFE